MRYKSLYISLPSSEKQQREMTKFCVVYETWTTTANFFVFPFGTERRRFICSCSTVLEPLAYRTDLLIKDKFIFYFSLSAASSLLELPNMTLFYFSHGGGNHSQQSFVRELMINILFPAEGYEFQDTSPY